MKYSETTAENKDMWVLRENAITKLSKTGVKGLSNRELICLSLVDTSNLFSCIAMDDVIQAFNRSSNTEELVSALMKIDDIKTEKVIELLAMSEIIRRKGDQLHKALVHPADIFQVVRPYFSDEQENLIVVGMNGANEQIFTKVVTAGLVNLTLVHPREVFADAIQKRCTSIAIAHNHPSGHTLPSPEDIAMTKRIREAGQILGIRVLDHLVFTDDSYFSFIEHDM